MKNATKLISTRIPTDLYEEFVKYATVNGHVKQWLVTEALREYLALRKGKGSKNE
jgi:hypothetical protein